MGCPEAVVEILHVLQAMPEWMAGMVLIVALLLAIGYVIGKVTVTNGAKLIHPSG